MVWNIEHLGSEIDSTLSRVELFRNEASQFCSWPFDSISLQVSIGSADGIAKGCGAEITAFPLAPANGSPTKFGRSSRCDAIAGHIRIGQLGYVDRQSRGNSG